MGDVVALLPEHIANQIAAGEVIQRPASVIKELMENAVDAQATKIEVIIKDAGKTLIQVIDNGSGMSPTDAVKCFDRHATSKVAKVEDLFALSTKGFRGEALASIAAIAHVSLKTRSKENDTGTQVDIEGSEIKNNTEVVTPIGASFEVKNLFYNVPARRNFLKSEQAEFRHIKEEFERITLAHPDIEFTLLHNGKEIHHLLTAVRRKRIVAIIGGKQNERLVPIEETTDIVQVEGFVAKPEFAKKSRGDQYLFVNDRFFKHPYFNHAINKAFEGLVPPKTYPGYYLYFTIDASKIDVNVHPTKTEIKFEEEKFIYAILVSSIRQALGKYNIAPSLDFERETSFDIPSSMKKQTAVEPSINVNPNYNPFQSSKGKSAKANSKAIQSHGFGNDSFEQEDWKNFYTIEEETKEVRSEEIFQPNTNQVSAYIIKSPYLFTPSKNGLLVIHFRRAYERIVYDKLMHDFVGQPIASQKMLFPLEKEISSSEKSIWEENNALLEQLGFSGEIKKDTIEVTGIPSVLQEEAINNCLDYIFQSLQFQDIEKGDIAHVLIQSISKNAGKKKDILTTKESVESLIEQLFQCPEHAFTASGNAIMKSVELEELHQKF